MRREMSVVLPLLFLAFSFFGCSKGELPDKGISILTPQGNDAVTTGGPFEIQWKTEVPKSDFGEMVQVEFSKDAGKSWEIIAENIPNTGKYSWKVDKKDSPQSKVRVISQYRPEYRGTSAVFVVK